MQKEYGWAPYPSNHSHLLGVRRQKKEVTRVHTILPTQVAHECTTLASLEQHTKEPLQHSQPAAFKLSNLSLHQEQKEVRSLEILHPANDESLQILSQLFVVRKRLLFMRKI